VSWTIIDCIRFPLLLIKSLTNWSPPPLEWLRYLLPLVLYPLGGWGEGYIMYQASPYAMIGGKFWGTEVYLSVRPNPNPNPDPNPDLATEVYPLAPLINYVYLPLWFPGFMMLYIGAIKNVKKKFFGRSAEVDAKKEK